MGTEFWGKDTDAQTALAQDDVVGDKTLVHLEAIADASDKGRGAVKKHIIHVHGDATKASVAVGEAGTGDLIQNVEDLFPIVEGVEEGGNAAQIQEEGSEPKEVAGNSVELVGNDADVHGPVRDFDCQDLLYGLAVAQVVDHATEVVDARAVGQELKSGSVLCHLLVRAMAVANHWLGLDDFLSSQVEHQAQNAVHTGMLRTHVEGVEFPFGTHAQVAGVELSHR